MAGCSGGAGPGDVVNEIDVASEPSWTPPRVRRTECGSDADCAAAERCTEIGVGEFVARTCVAGTIAGAREPIAGAIDATETTPDVETTPEEEPPPMTSFDVGSLGERCTMLPLAAEAEAIATADALIAMRPGGHYRLTADIDLSGVAGRSGEALESFVLDGDGHVLRGYRGSSAILGDVHCFVIADVALHDDTLELSAPTAGILANRAEDGVFTRIEARGTTIAGESAETSTETGVLAGHATRVEAREIDVEAAIDVTCAAGWQVCMIGGVAGVLAQGSARDIAIVMDANAIGPTMLGGAFGRLDHSELTRAMSSGVYRHRSIVAYWDGAAGYPSTQTAGLVGQAIRAEIEDVGANVSFDVDTATGDVAGIVGNASSSTIRRATADVAIATSGDVVISSSLAGIAGTAADVTIERAHADVEIHAPIGAAHAGGIAGVFRLGHIEECSVTATLDAYMSGGIAGSASEGTIARSFVAIDGRGTYAAGGIAGIASGVAIEDCQAGGSTGGGLAGGVVGTTNGSSPVSIARTFYRGTLDGGQSGGMLGGFVNGSTATPDDLPIESSYWSTSLASCESEAWCDTLGAAGGIDDEAFTDPSTFVGWDFLDVWRMGDRAPVLAWVDDERTR